MSLEVHLHELPSGVAAHHHVEEHLVGTGLEEVLVIDEGHVDASSIIGVSVDDLVVASR